MRILQNAAGVLPACYENTAIEVELQEQSEFKLLYVKGREKATAELGLSFLAYNLKKSD